MPYLEWTDSLSVNIIEIDEQHKNLISMINRIYDAMLANKGHEIQQEIVVELSEYVTYHFATEEKYMRISGYPEFVAHVIEHMKFAAEVTDLMSRFEKNGSLHSKEVFTLLRDWLQNHIIGTDMKYSEFFKVNGLK